MFFILFRSFYGFYEKDLEFLKVYLCNPMHLRRLCELFQAGEVEIPVPDAGVADASVAGSNRVRVPLPVYGAHVPYYMQFLIDADLYGMHWLSFRARPDSLPHSLPSLSSARVLIGLRPMPRLSHESRCTDDNQFGAQTVLLATRVRHRLPGHHSTRPEHRLTALFTVKFLSRAKISFT